MHRQRESCVVDSVSNWHTNLSIIEDFEEKLKAISVTQTVLRGVCVTNIVSSFSSKSSVVEEISIRISHTTHSTLTHPIHSLTLPDLFSSLYLSPLNTTHFSFLTSHSSPHSLFTLHHILLTPHCSSSLFSLPLVLPATKDDPRQRKPDITTAKVQLGWEPKVQHTHTHTALGRQAHTYTHTYIHAYIHTHKYTHTLSHTRTDTHCRTEYFTYLLCDEVLILVSLEMHFSLNYFV